MELAIPDFCYDRQTEFAAGNDPLAAGRGVSRSGGVALEGGKHTSASDILENAAPPASYRRTGCAGRRLRCSAPVPDGNSCQRQFHIENVGSFDMHMPEKPALRKSFALPSEALRFPPADVTATFVASGRTVWLAVIPPRFSRPGVWLSSLYRVDGWAGPRASPVVAGACVVEPTSVALAGWRMLRSRQPSFAAFSRAPPRTPRRCAPRG